ncbi:MAG: 2-hydroxyacid dehydrogenase [Bosea sp. (in: a-proteobacteria)]
MSLLIAMSQWDLESWRQRFRRHLPGMEIVALGEPFDRGSVHFAASWKHPEGALADLPALEAIFSLGAGVDHLFADSHLPDVPMARVVDPDLTSRMSEYIVLHCLTALRQQRRYDIQQRMSQWIDDRDQPAARDVRVGIMGMGVLGLDAAGKLMAMGFDVASWSRSRRDVEGLASFSGAEGFKPFLARTDILVNLLPATPDTDDILNRATFSALARDGRLGAPFIINAGRGASQNEADILACLDDGTLQHATLDVFRKEPLDAASPFWTHPKVTVTPHNSAMSDPEAICALIARQIDRLGRGLPLEHMVERARGY